MFKKITIIGLGLIGSSIARAIKKKNLCKNLIAHDKSESVLKTVLKIKIANQIEKNVKKSVENSDLVIMFSRIMLKPISMLTLLAAFDYSPLFLTQLITKEQMNMNWLNSMESRLS